MYRILQSLLLVVLGAVVLGITHPACMAQSSEPKIVSGAAAPASPEFDWFKQSVQRARQFADLLATTPEDKTFLVKAVAEVQEALDAGQYAKAYFLYNQARLQRMVLPLKDFRLIQNGPLSFIAASFEQNGVTWDDENIFTGQKMVITAANAGQTTIRYYASGRGWGPTPLELDRDDAFCWGPNVRGGSFGFNETVSVKERRVMWRIECSVPFDAQPRGKWPLMQLDLLSQSSFFCGGPLVVTTLTGETSQAEIPALNAPGWTQKFANVKTISLARQGQRFTFTLVPVGAATEGYAGMEVVGKSGEGFTFTIACAPAAETWKAGSTYVFMGALDITPRTR